MFGFVIIFAVLFHILYLRLLNGVILVFLVTMLFFIIVLLILSAIIIAMTLSDVEFNITSPNAVKYCNRYVYEFFYYFFIIHGVIFLCLMVNITFGSYCLFSFSGREAHRQKPSKK